MLQSDQWLLDWMLREALSKEVNLGAAGRSEPVAGLNRVQKPTRLWE